MTDHNNLNANKILEAINAYKLPEDFLKDNANGDITTTPGIMVQPASPGGWLKNWNPGVSENGNPDGDLNDNRRHYYPYYNNNTAKNPHDQASLLTPDQGEPLNDLKDDDNNLKSLGMEDNSLEGSMTSATSKTPGRSTYHYVTGLNPATHELILMIPNFYKANKRCNIKKTHYLLQMMPL